MLPAALSATFAAAKEASALAEGGFWSGAVAACFAGAARAMLSASDAVGREAAFGARDASEESVACTTYGRKTGGAEVAFLAPLLSRLAMSVSIDPTLTLMANRSTCSETQVMGSMTAACNPIQP